MTSGISEDLNFLKDELKNISNITSDLCSTVAGLGIVLDELKSLSAGIGNIETQINYVTLNMPDSPYEVISPSPDPLPSLLEELNNEQNVDDSGWRLLGMRRVWKADWSDYDARKSRRLNQQKHAEKARRKRKQNTARNYSNVRNNIHSNSLKHRNHRNMNSDNGYSTNHSNIFGHRSIIRHNEQDNINSNNKNNSSYQFHIRNHGNHHMRSHFGASFAVTSFKV